MSRSFGLSLVIAALLWTSPGAYAGFVTVESNHDRIGVLEDGNGSNFEITVTNNLTQDDPAGFAHSRDISNVSGRLQTLDYVSGDKSDKPVDVRAEHSFDPFLSYSKSETFIISFLTDNEPNEPFPHESGLWRLNFSVTAEYDDFNNPGKTLIVNVDSSVEIEVRDVPEPSSLMLLAAASSFVSILARRRRWRRSACEIL
jgi:hypothetical protein